MRKCINCNIEWPDSQSWCPHCEGYMMPEPALVVESGSLQAGVLALEERWARRLADAGPANDNDLKLGMKLQLDECLKELRAEIGKRQND